MVARHPVTLVLVPLIRGEVKVLVAVEVTPSRGWHMREGAILHGQG